MCRDVGSGPSQCWVALQRMPRNIQKRLGKGSWNFGITLSRCLHVRRVLRQRSTSVMPSDQTSLAPSLGMRPTPERHRNPRPPEMQFPQPRHRIDRKFDLIADRVHIRGLEAPMREACPCR